jgi:hypothetical protein
MKCESEHVRRLVEDEQLNEKMTAFWDTAPCSLVEVDQRFRGEYYPHHQGILMMMALMMEAVRTSETSF